MSNKGKSSFLFGRLDILAVGASCGKRQGRGLPRLILEKLRNKGFVFWYFGGIRSIRIERGQFEFGKYIKRSIAQLGSALVLGTRGRKFESCYSDHKELVKN